MYRENIQHIQYYIHIYSYIYSYIVTYTIYTLLKISIHICIKLYAYIDI